MCDCFPLSSPAPDILHEDFLHHSALITSSKLKPLLAKLLASLLACFLVNVYEQFYWVQFSIANMYVNDDF